MNAVEARARILVAISETEETSARLEIAAQLAKGLHLELIAVLLEQQALLDLLRLPVAQEVTLLGGSVRPLEGEALAHATRRREAHTRRRLQQLSSDAGLSWSLNRLRVAVGCAELEGLRRSGDILALSPALAEAAREGPLLITPTTGSAVLRPGPVAWVSDAGEEPPEAVARIAAALDRAFVSLTPAKARAGRYGFSSAAPSLLIAGRLKAPLDRPAGLLLLAQETACPVLLLGEGSDNAQATGA